MSQEKEETGAHLLVNELALRLRRRQVRGSRECALETSRVIRQVVLTAEFANPEDLIAIVKATGRILVEAQPKEHAIGNTICRILHHIREEFNATLNNAAAKTSQKPGYSISNFVLMGQPKKHHPFTPKQLDETATCMAPQRSYDFSDHVQSVRPVLLEAVKDVRDELRTVYDNISKSAKDHIHSDEIILTIGKSKTVETFLLSAAHYRNFTIIVAETSPSCTGHEMAQSLSSVGISTFLVPDSSIYAIMSRVNKVILGAHAILANGGMIAITGSLMVANAAKEHSTPVVVCAGQFKLTPLWNLHHQYSALDYADPSPVLEYNEGDLVERVDVFNPYYDYVNPELLNAYITNDGDHPPTSIYRLIKETYDDEDINLFQ